MLNHKTISQMYVKAYKVFLVWLKEKKKFDYDFDIEYINSLNGSYLKYHMRDLYDFFDDNDINIEVYKEHVMGDKYSVRWCFDCGLIVSKGYETRLYAEWAAFKTGFKELEKRL